MFDFELETISRWISDGGYASVALQMPEGLKIRAPEISEFIERETGAVPVIVGRPCYGACDLFDYHGWADALIHFGHSPIPSQGDDPNVLYIESRSDAEVDESIIGSLSRLPERIGLLATVQYLGLIPKVKGMLESSVRGTAGYATPDRSSDATAALPNPSTRMSTAICSSERGTSTPLPPRSAWRSQFWCSTLSQGR